jgi:hypothetical protein
MTFVPAFINESHSWQQLERPKGKRDNDATTAQAGRTIKLRPPINHCLLKPSRDVQGGVTTICPAEHRPHFRQLTAIEE